MLSYRSFLRSAALVLIVSAAACGGGDKSASSDSAAAAAPAAAPAAEVASVDGAAVYQRCMVCHQATGVGSPGLYPPLAGSEIVNGPAEIPIRIVLKGLQGPVKVKGTTFNSMMMPYGTGAELSDAEVAAVLTYVRSQWGNTGAAVTAADVAKERAAVASRTTPWTVAELGIKQ